MANLLSYIYSHKVLRDVLKTEEESRGFQHFSPDLANVTVDGKIIFDPSFNLLHLQSQDLKKSVENRWRSHTNVTVVGKIMFDSSFDYIYRHRV